MLGIKDNTFYDQLEEIIELMYLRGFSVSLFRCKWFDLESSKKRVKTKKNITNINISSELVKDDHFILDSS